MASEELTRKLKRALLKKVKEAKELERFYEEGAKAILTPQEFKDCKQIVDKLAEKIIEKINKGNPNEPINPEELLDKEELARLRKYFEKGDEEAKRRLSYIR